MLRASHDFLRNLRPLAPKLKQRYDAALIHVAGVCLFRIPASTRHTRGY